MQLLGAGLNAHHQLSPQDGNVGAFERLALEADSVLLATWSTLIVQKSNEIITTGHQTLAETIINDAHSAFGDHNGLLGLLDINGLLHVSQENQGGESILQNYDSDTAPSLTFVTMAGNGRVVCTHVQAPNGNLIHVAGFDSFELFASWYKDPSNSQYYPAAHHMLPGRPKQLIAGTGTFAMLLENGEVFTWGDARYSSLARSTIGEDSVSPDQPGLVEALAGVTIKKICFGGWMGGAVSADGAAYIWGSGTSGSHTGAARRIEALSSTEKVALIQLCPEESGEPDIVDMDIGDGHVALLTAEGDLYVAGENSWGQLGLGVPDSFVGAFTKVKSVTEVKQVICAAKCTVLSCSS